MCLPHPPMLSTDVASGRRRVAQVRVVAFVGEPLCDMSWHSGRHPAVMSFAIDRSDEQ